MASSFPRSVTIYGTGLIGSSFALALKQTIPHVRILGVDSPQVLESARAIGAIDKGVDLGQAAGAEPSDLVVLAAPVGDILQLIGNLQPADSLILDVGSTKVDICTKAEERGLPFVGGHPMTGSERSGPEAASADLFRNSLFFLCPVSTTPADAVGKLESLLQAIGARPHVISPEEHDKLVAELSHLPQILSTVLAVHTGTHRDFAGPGWGSFTRLAASPFHVWQDILLTSGSLPEELRIYIRRLQAILDSLERKDLKQLEEVFERANRAVRDGANDLDEQQK